VCFVALFTLVSILGNYGVRYEVSAYIECGDNYANGAVYSDDIGQAAFDPCLGVTDTHGATKLIGKAASGIANKLGRCFVAGTAVLVLVNGVLTTKNIEDIRVGDIVASRNEISGAIEYKPVLNTETSKHSVIVKVGQSDGQVISSSLTHPYYVVGKGYVDAQNLRAGDMLLTVGGKGVIVEFVQHELLENPQILYNFEVADNNNYFVAENSVASTFDYVLVHNYCQGHHVITKDMAKAMAENNNLKNISRNKSSVFKALSEDAHKGYQKWHRTYDREMTEWIRTHGAATVEELTNELQKYYNKPDMIERFGEVIVKLFTK
jgi:hypothetical protein